MRLHLFAFIFISSSCMADEAKPQINFRAFENQTIEFAELDSLNNQQLEAVYCGYVLGKQVSSEATNKTIQQYEGDPKIQIMLLENNIKATTQFNNNIIKTGDLFKRKFGNLPANCDKYINKK